MDSKLEKALSDTLNPLISTYGDAVAAHGGATISNIDELLEDLRKAAVLRNVICHGSWRIPDSNGKSVPLFVDKKGNVFAEEIDGVYLEHLQRHTAELACSIVNTVTHMGLQFPGSNGPGMPIFSRQS